MNTAIAETQTSESHFTPEEANEIATTILTQLGGANRLKAFIGANLLMSGENFLGSNMPYLKVAFEAGAKNGANFFVVAYDYSSDTYVMEFWKDQDLSSIPSGDAEYKAWVEQGRISRHENVYCDGMTTMFEQETHLFLSF